MLPLDFLRTTLKILWIEKLIIVKTQERSEMPCTLLTSLINAQPAIVKNPKLKYMVRHYIERYADKKDLKNEKHFRHIA